MLRHLVSQKLTDFSEVLTASIIREISELAFLIRRASNLRKWHRLIALMMGTVSISETSANFYEITRRNIPEDSHLHARHENLKFHSSNNSIILR
jgi:hypothetical protein